MTKEKQQLFSYINREEPCMTLGGHIKQLIDLISPLHVTSLKLDSPQSVVTKNDKSNEIIWVGVHAGP